MTEVRNFDTIEATKVVEANEKLYINRAEGFIGTGLKKDEFVCNCSDMTIYSFLPQRHVQGREGERRCSSERYSLLECLQEE